MKNIIASLSLPIVLSMSTLCFGMEKDRAEKKLSKEFFQTVEPELFEQIETMKEKANAEYKAGFKGFLNKRLSHAEEGMSAKNVMYNESYYLAATTFYSKRISVWSGKAAIHNISALNDNCKRALMANYGRATDKAMEALKCIKAGCYVESESGFDFATAYGLAKVSQEEYGKKLDEIVCRDDGGWMPLHLEGSATLAQILLKELSEEKE